jgi:lysozyme
MAWTIDDDGIRFIAGWEGWRARPYLDVGGKLTVGYGHLVRPGEQFDELTEAEGLELLRADVATAERAVLELVPPASTQSAHNALVSFAYNLGGGMLGKGHTLGDALRAGDLAGAAAAFVLYDHVGGAENAGLRHRRLAERALFEAEAA